MFGNWWSPGLSGWLALAAGVGIVALPFVLFIRDERTPAVDPVIDTLRTRRARGEIGDDEYARLAATLGTGAVTTADRRRRFALPALIGAALVVLVASAAFAAIAPYRTRASLVAPGGLIGRSGMMGARWMGGYGSMMGAGWSDGSSSIVGRGGMMGRFGPWASPSATGVPGSSAAPAPGGSSQVGMKDDLFSPASLAVKTGATVVWLNDDDVSHTVTAVDGSWSSGQLAPGSTYRRTFSSPGTSAYFCLDHPWMRATITVQP